MSFRSKLNSMKFLSFVIVLLSFGQVFAQNGQPSQKDALKVYLDRFWQQQYIKQEMPFLNYVNDTRDSDVYVLQSRQTTGSGGQEFTLTFQGQGKFLGVNDTLVHAFSPDDVEAIRREGLRDLLTRGLFQYINKTPHAESFKISYNRPRASSTSVTVDDDPWNKWVFNINTSAEFDGNDNSEDLELSETISAGRTTEDWKISIWAHMKYSDEKTYTTNETTKVKTLSDRYIQREYYFNNLIVKSVSDHWSIGAATNYVSHEKRNLETSFSFYPAAEFDFFPYSESTRHQIMFLFESGAEYVDYYDETVYDKMDEIIYKARFSISGEMRDKWGSINTSLSSNVNIADPEFNRFSWRGGFDIRVAKGFSVRLSGNVSRERDQLNIRKEGASLQDILLERQELQSDWEYGFNVGLRFRFGSIYNNVVNPRMGHRRR